MRDSARVCASVDGNAAIDQRVKATSTQNVSGVRTHSHSHDSDADVAFTP